ncbi:MAG: riboflavin synthase [Flavobacteriaceae bacterium]|nr:riboflavin synthase [Flavobacteriaceae bacterium]
MFTGIVEATATVENIETMGTSVHFTMSCPFTDELKIDQSLSHNGCCLTIEKIENQRYGVTAIQETLEKTNLGSWKIGTKVNLERCVLMNGRLDGHIVQGHVDQTGTIKSIENLNGSHYITIAYTEKDGFTTVPQGSITVDGISLTVAHSGENEFSVAIIPYTWEHTNLKNLEIGSKVNLEFDIIGKYVAKLMKK